MPQLLIYLIIFAAVGYFIFWSFAASPAPIKGIFISNQEIAALPTAGTAWDNMKAAADKTFPSAAVCSANMDHDTDTLAAALVYARTGESSYRTKTANAINDAIGTEDANPCPATIVGSRHQGVSRNGAAYVIAADLIDLEGYSTSINSAFKTWITSWTTRRYDSGFTNVEWMEDRPNNVGYYAGATLAAAYAYLGDRAGLDHVHQVFKGATGDISSWSGWSASDSAALSFVPDGQSFRAINPKGAIKNGYNVDGYEVWEWKRCGSFVVPPCYTDYIWTSDGLLTQAQILSKAGYADVFDDGDQAIKRMIEAIYRQYQSGRTEFWTLTSTLSNWQIWFINYAYGTNIPATHSTKPGFQMGWGDWMFGGRTRAQGQPASLTADINKDGLINILDLSILLSNYGKSGTASIGDINSDGIVDILDLSVLMSNYGK